MKTTLLWKDPVGWSEGCSKTPIRILITIMFHAALVFAGIYQVGKFATYEISQTQEISSLTLAVFSLPIIMIGIWMPALYLYAMYRLLKTIREKDQPESTETLHCK
jgi:predicted membrane protein